jgi:hypothetical protein
MGGTPQPCDWGVSTDTKSDPSNACYGDADSSKRRPEPEPASKVCDPMVAVRVSAGVPGWRIHVRWYPPSSTAGGRE